MKVFDLPTAANLSEGSLREALTVLEPPGWAELIVHPSQLQLAMKLSRAHVAKGLALSVLSDSKIGRDDWRLRSKDAEVRSLCG